MICQNCSSAADLATRAAAKWQTLPLELVRRSTLVDLVATGHAACTGGEKGCGCQHKVRDVAR